MSARRKRHTRAHVRSYRDRIVAKRARQARELQWWFDPDWTPVEGRLENEQWYIGCRRPRCGICHPDKRLAPRGRSRPCQARVATGLRSLIL